MDEETLFVTFLDPQPGKFFGQLERRSVEELNAVLTELEEIYSNEAKPKLLYSDAQNHCGDFGVIKWSADGHFYRVHVSEEIASDAVVYLVDYGNVVRVPKMDIFAPVNLLTQFTQPAFGIHCQVDDVRIDYKVWFELTMNKSVHVKIGACLDGTYNVTLTDPALNQAIVEKLASSRLTLLSSGNNFVIILLRLVPFFFKCHVDIQSNIINPSLSLGLVFYLHKVFEAIYKLFSKQYANN